MIHRNHPQKITPGRVLRVLDFLYRNLVAEDGEGSAGALAERFQEEQKRTGQDFWELAAKEAAWPVQAPEMGDMAVSKQLWSALSLAAVCACLGGADLKQETIKAAVFLALLGREAPEVLEDLSFEASDGVSLAFGWDCAGDAVAHFSHDQMVQIRQTVGIRFADAIREKKRVFSVASLMRTGEERSEKEIEKAARHLFSTMK